MKNQTTPIHSTYLLPHERLDVFHVSIELIQHVTSIQFPRGNADLRDQLRRAAASIALDIGEGAANLKVLEAIMVIDKATHDRGRHLCGRIFAMLSSLSGSTRQR